MHLTASMQVSAKLRFLRRTFQFVVAPRHEVFDHHQIKPFLGASHSGG